MPTRSPIHQPTHPTGRVRLVRPGQNSHYTSARWRRLRMMVLRRQHGCADCGAVTQANFHVDHKVKRSQGGRDTLENLQVLCPSCHGRKTRTEQDDG